MAILRVADNNNISIYKFDTIAAAFRERSKLIQAYGYNRKKGFTRVTRDNILIFNHAIYSTVIFTVTP